MFISEFRDWKEDERLEDKLVLRERFIEVEDARRSLPDCCK
jgi:hypothetical protein